MRPLPSPAMNLGDSPSAKARVCNLNKEGIFYCLWSSQADTTSYLFPMFPYTLQQDLLRTALGLGGWVRGVREFVGRGYPGT